MNEHEKGTEDSRCAGIFIRFFWEFHNQTSALDNREWECKLFRCELSHKH